MIAEFDWWLLIVGLVLGAGLTWLVVSESRREDGDLDAIEQASEAVWIVARLKRAYPRLNPDQVTAILDEHRGYLAAPPPDPMAADESAEPDEPAASAEPAEPIAATGSERPGQDGVVG